MQQVINIGLIKSALTLAAAAYIFTAGIRTHQLYTSEEMDWAREQGSGVYGEIYDKLTYDIKSSLPGGNFNEKPKITEYYKKNCKEMESLTCKIKRMPLPYRSCKGVETYAETCKTIEQHAAQNQ